MRSCAGVSVRQVSAGHKHLLRTIQHIDGVYAWEHLAMELKESWYEKLCR
jgi:hypothetical protein